MGAKKAGEVSVYSEKEMQFYAAPRTFNQVRDWVSQEKLAHGGEITKPVVETVIHYDTPGNRLFAKGMTLRSKDKGNGMFCHDLKVPQNLETLSVAPDDEGVISRDEIRYVSNSPFPDLKIIFNSKIISEELRDILDGIVDRKTVPKFQVSFSKQKFRIPYSDDEGSGINEFNLQSGAIRTMDNAYKTPIQRIVELELKKGPESVLALARTRLLDEFKGAGLDLLMERKAVQGFGLLYNHGYMTPNARRRYEEGLELHMAPAMQAA